MYRGRKVGGRGRRGHTSAMPCRNNALLYDSESMATKSNSIRTIKHPHCTSHARDPTRSGPKARRITRVAIGSSGSFDMIAALVIRSLETNFAAVARATTSSRNCFFAVARATDYSFLMGREGGNNHEASGPFEISAPMPPPTTPFWTLQGSLPQ